ncbi:MAG: ABC transporter permease [Dehalococcoidia bacterium]|nr:MAG: ABC transporter permease [Dehalococcoidia bacterium]
MTVFRKELADHFSGWRFMIVFLLIYAAGLSALWIASQYIRSEVTDTSKFIFLKLFAISGGGLESLLFFMVLLIPVVGIVLGFDAINSERASGNLSRLLSQPLYRDSVINGKFLAGLVTLAVLVLSLVAVVAGLGLRMIGVPPTAEEVLRLFAFIFLSIISGAFWMSLAVLFSVLFKQVATSALASLGLWLFLLLFLFFGIAHFIAGQNLEIAVMLNRMSPIFLYQEAVRMILLPTTMTGFGVYPAELFYPLSFGQSLLLVWPQIVSMIALTALCFAISYIKFMREEIRAT